MRKCEECGNEIPLIRLEAVPDTKFCVRCAEKHGPQRPKGFMVATASKGTASVLVTVDPRNKEDMRRANRAHRRER
jgi:hypothetical protein